MSEKISLKDAEQKVFRTAYNDGLWDIFLGCFFLIFVIAPYLSPSLGDFWSSFVFLPFWGLIYLALWLIRKFVVIPRVGVVKLGPVRKTRLAKFTIVMLVINLATLLFGIIASFKYVLVPGQVYSIGIGIIFLIGFSLAAFYLNFSRLYVYGLLVGLSPLIGEWLWKKGIVTHHGFPITFGVTATIMILVGLAVLLRLVHNNPLPIDGIPSQET